MSIPECHGCGEELDFSNTNEMEPEYCKFCKCDHSFNCEGECEYCGARER